MKDRILEFLAVRKLKPDARSSILCFVGPPGVGKTSLGRSIAAAMGRKFERISVGGVRDEAEIRGHRRTYIGAMPGTIIRAMRDAESNNPVLMIDEIDKMGADFRGDPASAMLEVLDPEQNSTFRDHYLDLPFDLSNVLFITTANQLDTVPGPLLDRMEVIELAGYTHEEKLEIAKRYLVPRQIERHGLGRSKIEFMDDALEALIDGYTREAGVRNLERQIGSVSRKVAREFAEGSRKSKKAIRAQQVRRAARQAALRGRRGVAHRQARRGHRPGLDSRGWRRAVRGGHRLPRRGQAPDHGPARRRDARVGRRRRCPTCGATPTSSRCDLPADYFRTHDFHLHVPAGAIPKDGPSAGITMATALASLITGRPVRSDTAMTGEITLTGRVLPIGGLKEKALAAQRAEVKRMIIPAPQRADIEDIPAHLRKRMEFSAGRHGRRGAGCSPLEQPGGRARQRQRRVAGLREAGIRLPCKADLRREMAAKKKAAKAGAGAVAAGNAVRSNEYVQRLIEDEELRENLRTAYQSARKAYGRIATGRARSRPSPRTRRPIRSSRRRQRRCATRPSPCAGARRSASAAVSAGFCSWASSAAAWRWR